MNKNLSYTFLSQLLKNSRKCAGYIFAIATTILTFISLDDILDKIELNNLSTKIFVLLLLLIISVIIAFFVLKHNEKKGITVFSKEKASINIKFDDMSNYICKNNSAPYTVVIPINTSLNCVADLNEIRENSIHGIWIKTMLSYNYSTEDITKEILERINTDKDNICKIGDYCYIKNIRNVNYLLVATCKLDENNKSCCNETEYLCGIQKMVNAIVRECDIQEKIFIPIIGGGYAFMGKSNQELLEILSEIFMFNIQNIQHEINIIVYDKLKQEIIISNMCK